MGKVKYVNLEICKDDKFSYALQLDMAMLEKDLLSVIESIK